MIQPLRCLVVGTVVAIAILSLVQLLLDQPAALETTDLLQGGSGAYEALGFLARQRAYPRATLPPQGYGSAFAQAQAMSKRKLDTQWETMGPHNIAGRMLAVALNPQNPGTVWAGSAGGGLWRSHTGGVGAAAWSYVATGHPVLAVSAIVIAPADSNVIYIGTGEVYNHTNTQGGVAIWETRGSYGMGILKSTNNGRTWVRSLDWSRNQQRGVQMLRINPKNPNTVWAATTEGVYVTHDAGANWHRSLDVVIATDVVIHPVDTSLVFAACGNLGSSGKGIYRTSNGGASWEKLNNGLPTDYFGKTLLDISQSTPDTIYASIGGGSGTLGERRTWLVRSTNRGDSWGWPRERTTPSFRDGFPTSSLSILKTPMCCWPQAFLCF